MGMKGEAVVGGLGSVGASRVSGSVEKASVGLGAMCMAWAGGRWQGFGFSR
jgi:hypothetical protein